MKKLNEKEWREFRFMLKSSISKRSVDNVKPTRSALERYCISWEKDTNNGVHDLLRNDKLRLVRNHWSALIDLTRSYYRDYANCVTNDRSVGNAFYQPYPAPFDMKVHCLQYTIPR